MACGLGLGLYAGPSVAGLGELGRVVIQLIKAAAAPLSFRKSRRSKFRFMAPPYFFCAAKYAAIWSICWSV